MFQITNENTFEIVETRAKTNKIDIKKDNINENKFFTNGDQVDKIYHKEDESKLNTDNIGNVVDDIKVNPYSFVLENLYTKLKNQIDVKINTKQSIIYRFIK